MTAIAMFAVDIGAGLVAAVPIVGIAAVLVGLPHHFIAPHLPRIRKDSR